MVNTTKIGFLLAALLLAGCSDSAREMSFPAAPEELSDCKFYYLTNSGGAGVTVVRCPNSATTTTRKEGKTTKTAVTIDGVEYVRKDQ